jgi:GNAT superfamily N-acetyltransferase
LRNGEKIENLERCINNLRKIKKLIENKKQIYILNNVLINKFELSYINEIKYLQPEGWDDIVLYFLFYTKHYFCYPVVAIVDSNIIGVANCILNDNTGWLSHIIVAKEYRRKGIGAQLTQFIMDYLDINRIKTQLLIATELGEPVYSKLGFRVVSRYYFYKCSKLKIKLDKKCLKNLPSKDFINVLEIDKEISGEGRKNMLEQHKSNGWGYYDSKSGDLRGYFLPDFGEGHIIAKDKQAGIELMKLKHSQKDCKTVLPEENKDGIKFLEANGFKKYSTAARMVLGEDIPWKPNSIYSRVGGFYG